jgi:hypothetical protein
MNKTETLTGLRPARKKIVAVARALPVEKRDEVFLGVWSAKDLLAHLVGWDYANIDSVRDIRARRVPRVFKFWNPDWGSFNAKLVRENKREDWNEMLKAIRGSHAKLIAFLKEVPAGDFNKDFGIRSPRGRTITVAEHLQAEIEDETTHLKQMRDWLKR